jgi:hypothetical protein
MENKQTAIQQLINEIVEHLIYDDDLSDDSRMTLETIRLRCLGKLSIEKEQIIDAYDKGEFNQGCNEDAEQYYIETYESKEIYAKDVILGYKTSLDAQMLDRIEPKQETLEEAAEKYANELPEPYNYGINLDKKKGFIEGAKWQAERMYSEEEVEAIWKFALYSAEQHDKFGTKNKSNFITKDVKEFIEQFKKEIR